MKAAAETLVRLAAVAEGRCAGNGTAHDYLHVRRVAATAQTLARSEAAREDVAVAAALLHELWNYPKDRPNPRGGARSTPRTGAR